MNHISGASKYSSVSNRRTEKLLKVLIFARDAEWQGGVVDFVGMLSKNLADQVTMERFVIGRRKTSIGRLLSIFIPLIDGFRLAYKLTTSRYDAYHLNPSLNMPSILREGLFLLVMRVMRARNVLVSFHGWDESVAERISRNALFQWLFKAVYQYADSTLVLAVPFREKLLGWGFDTDRVGIFTTMFDGEQFQGLIHDKNTSAENLIFMARFVREKGVYELLEAFHRLVPSRPLISLVMAGAGPEEKDMQRWVSERGLQGRVEFPGFLRDKEKFSALLDADVFVLPTYGEGCPVVLLEAMASGLPVITTSVGGIPQVVKDGVNGVVLENVNTETICKAITGLLDNKNVCLEMGDNNRKEAWKKYNLPVVADMFLSLYRGDRTAQKTATL